MSGLRQSGKYPIQVNNVVINSILMPVYLRYHLSVQVLLLGFVSLWFIQFNSIGAYSRTQFRFSDIV